MVKVITDHGGKDNNWQAGERQSTGANPDKSNATMLHSCRLAVTLPWTRYERLHLHQ